MTNLDRGPLTPEQQLVLVENTLLVATTDLAGFYHGSLSQTADFYEHSAQLSPIPYKAEQEEFAAQTRTALEAHKPFAFKLTPSNLAVSIHMIKVEPDNGEELPASDLQIALVVDPAIDPANQDSLQNALAASGPGVLTKKGTEMVPYFGNHGRVSTSSTEIALGQLYKQKEHGLVYGLAHTSFLADY